MPLPSTKPLVLTMQIHLKHHQPSQPPVGSSMSQEGETWEDHLQEEGEEGDVPSQHHKDHPKAIHQEAVVVEEAQVEGHSHLTGKYPMPQINSWGMHPLFLQETEPRSTPSSHSGNYTAVSTQITQPSKTNIRRQCSSSLTSKVTSY